MLDRSLILLVGEVAVRHRATDHTTRSKHCETVLCRLATFVEREMLPDMLGEDVRERARCEHRRPVIPLGDVEVSLLCLHPAGIRLRRGADDDAG
jgi:hypothetical protein